MNILGKIVEKLNVKASVLFKGNRKNISKQKDAGVQVVQGKNGITNVFYSQSVDVETIKKLTSFGTTENSEPLPSSAGRRFFAEQTTMQSFMAETVEKAGLDSIANPQELERDWFLRWMDVAKGVSRETVQVILARILADEIREPNSVSLRTLDVVKNLSKEELEIFQKFCDVSFSINIDEVREQLLSVISEPFGQPGGNALKAFGLSYEALTMLQDAGLVKNDLSSYVELLVPSIFLHPFSLGAETLKFTTTSEGTDQTRIRIKQLLFTNAGRELRRMMTLGSNEQYVKEFVEWIETKWSLRRTL